MKHEHPIARTHVEGPLGGNFLGRDHVSYWDYYRLEMDAYDWRRVPLPPIGWRRVGIDIRSELGSWRSSDAYCSRLRNRGHL